MKKIFLFLLLVLVMFSCSRKKFNFKNKSYHKLTAYYNTIFNGQETLDQILKGNQSFYQDDYYKILRVIPSSEVKVSEDFFANPEDEVENTKKSKADIKKSIESILGMGLPGRIGNQAKPNDKKTNVVAKTKESSSGLDRVSEKSKKAIENHSMFNNKKLKEENRMMVSAYLLLGKARYYEGRPIPALNALDYAELFVSQKSRKFNDVLLYQAKTNELLGNYSLADVIYGKLLQRKKVSRKLKHEILRNYAQFLINQKEYKNAIEILQKAKKYTFSKRFRSRYTYIQGQLFQILGNEIEARNYYRKVFTTRAGFEFEVKSQLASATTFNKESDDFESFKNSLMSQTRKGVYDKYRNEIFYAIAKLAHENSLEDESRKFITKSLEEKESDSEIRGLAFGLKGDLEFDDFDYIESAAYYDSAVSKITNPDVKKRYQDLLDRLEGVKEKHYTVLKNDSILSLIQLSDEDRIKRVEEIIKDLKIREEKELELLEKAEKKKNKEKKNKGVKESFIENMDGESNNVGQFYFYSRSLTDKGKTEFKKKWGDRKLVENWRLVVKNNSPIYQITQKPNDKPSAEKEKDSLLAKAEPKDPRRFDPEYYLEKIPERKSLEETMLKLERDSAQLFLGQLYYDRFRNKDLAIGTLRKLIHTPPALIPVEREAYYTIFRITEEENLPGSDTLRHHIMESYPDWSKANFLKNKESGKFQFSSQESIDFYTQTFDAYEKEDYNTVLQNFNIAKEKYYSEKILEKFYLLAAYSRKKVSNQEEFVSLLKTILVSFPPSSEVSEQAKKLLLEIEKKDPNKKEKESTQENSIEVTEKMEE